MYNDTYAEAFAIVTLREVVITPALTEKVYDTDGALVSENEVRPAVTAVLPDLPAPVTSYQLAVDSRIFIDGQDIPKAYQDRECLIHVTFRREEEFSVVTSPGYIPGVGSSIMAHPRYTEFYNVPDEQGNPTPFVPNCAEGYTDK